MATKKAAKPRRAKRQKSRARKFWGRLGIAALVGFIILSLAGMGTFFYLYSTTKLPDPNSDFTTNTTFLFYKDGETQLGSLAVQNRVTIPYEQMPEVMKQAVVAAENRSFWEDPGFSVSGIARSAWSIARGGELQGGSTITQQYIKILYLDSGQRMSRKVKELMLATKMGRELPKEEILEGYLNTIYFGRGAYGIEAAAKSYFLKPAADLTVEEAAALAAILNNPAGFNPSGGEAKRERLLGRYQYVVDGMLDMGYITQEQHAKARPALPEFPEVPVNNRYGGPKGFLIKMVEDELEDLGFSAAEVQGGGLKVVTTLDKRMQDSAVEVAQRYAKQATDDGRDGAAAGQLKVALSSVDTATGGLLAMYGGADYVENSRNWASTPRAAASTFKTFATVAGLRNGFSLKSLLNGDSFTPRGDSKPVNNQAGRNYGEVTLRKSVADSINTAFVDMTEQIPGGPEQVVKAANDAGAPTAGGWDLNNRIALGAAEVSPTNMANSYATLANGGKRNTVHVVAQVLDRNGDVLYEAKPTNDQMIDGAVAANVTDALTAVVGEGTGRRASELGRPVAGKTGTHEVDDTIQSGWFVGYTKQVSTAVMYVVGDSGTGDLRDYRRPGDRTFFGSSYPLMTWLDYMKVATEGMPVEQFDEPRPIVATRGKESQSPRPSASMTEETVIPSETPSETPSESPTPSPTPTPTPTEAVTPTETPTSEPTTVRPTPDPTPVPEPTTVAPTQPAETQSQQPSKPADPPARKPTATATGAGATATANA